jgi:hypothetical protein
MHAKNFNVLVYIAFFNFYIYIESEIEAQKKLNTCK